MWWVSGLEGLDDDHGSAAVGAGIGGHRRLLGLGVVLAGVLTVPLNPPPDVLASGDGKLVAVRGAEGELLVSRKEAVDSKPV